ncbi:MAG: leucyl/phenylalanyl-tRNA--protein transferase [Giesbergeria sp.]
MSIDHSPQLRAVSSAFLAIPWLHDLHPDTVTLPWLGSTDPFPPVSSAWDTSTPAPGLLAAGGDLTVDRLRSAYAHGIFPWYSGDQPILWWSPDPRMVLQVAQFRLHRSLRQVLERFRRDAKCEIRVDHDFAGVIAACAQTPRAGQAGTWIGEDMQHAYTKLHQAGTAHSIETWVNGQRVGGLYCVAIGRAVFGESMFSLVPEASKIALAALVALCRQHGIASIDCQQNTPHLARLGAREMPRSQFANGVALALKQAPVEWQFKPLYWNEILPIAPTTR